MGEIKLAVIGCGAMTELAYMPALAGSNKFDVTILVDIVQTRAQLLANKYGVPAVTDDYRKTLGKVDAAIIVLPHFLHAPVTIDLQQHGIHVLVEKPMALKTSDCDEMMRAASDAGALLAVGLIRRFYGSSRVVKQVLESNLLGDIMSFDFREGFNYNWDAVSDYAFRKEAGGGVLADCGAHVLDLLLWWLGDFQDFTYYDDAFGGVEADCELYLRLQEGVEGVAELSRTRTLRNSFIIRGDKATLEIGTGFNSFVHLKLGDQNPVLNLSVAGNKLTDETFLDIILRQLDDFGDSIINNREPFVSGREGKRAVELIESCYASRQPLKKPWVFSERPLRGEGA